MSTQQQVRDADRLITFEGRMLGHVSSKRPSVARWTEMTVYLTAGGSLVLEKVGRSTVCHYPGCTETSGLPRFQEAHHGADPDEGFIYHEDCVPETYDFPSLLVEADRYWAKVTNSPEEIVSALERRRDGVVSLPRIGSDLLSQVTESYPEFGDFWRVTHIR